MAAKRTPSSPTIPFVQNVGLWGGVILGVLILAMAIAGIQIKRKLRNRKKRHGTAWKDGQQRVPLMPGEM